MVWTNPSSRPHPRKRRFAQDRRDSTAVQILSPDFLGLSNYKAISRFERQSGFERNRDITKAIEWAVPAVLSWNVVRQTITEAV